MTFTSRLGKAFNRLSELFHEECLLPEHDVQQEMKKEGWKFDIQCLPLPYAFVPVIQIAITPEGRPAIGFNATAEDNKRYLDTIAAKRNQLNLTP